MFRKFFEKITGIAKIKRETQAALEEARRYEEVKAEALRAAETAVEEERIAKLSPKERATAKKEAWVAVLDTHVNKDNIRNGFFELDWNEYFIIQLKQAGYGYDGDPDEEIVDRWFRDLAANMLSDEGLDPSSRTAGYINVTKLADGKAQVE